MIRLYEFLKTNETGHIFVAFILKFLQVKLLTSFIIIIIILWTKFLKQILQIFFGRRYFFREPRQEAILKLASGRQKYPRKVEGSQNNDFLVLYFLFCSVQQQLMQSD